jgi:hypothetical protein
MAFRNQVHRPFRGLLGPGWKRELRLFEINRSIALVNAELKRLREEVRKNRSDASVYSKELLDDIPLLRVPCRYPVGSVVRTEYGIGFVRHFRPQDGIYEVHVHWGGRHSAEGVLKCRRGGDEGCSACDAADYRRGVTPCCVRGIFVKVFLLAGNLRPAPSSNVPAYNASASIAQASTRTAIWQSVTGLLGGSGRNGSDVKSAIISADKAGDAAYPDPERPKIGRALNAIKSIWKGMNDNAAVPEFLKDYYGALVWTPYGEGHILGVHRSGRRVPSAKGKSSSGAEWKDMVTVRLHWGALCCIKRQATTFLSGTLDGVEVGIGAFPLRPSYENASLYSKAIQKAKAPLPDLKAMGSQQGAIFSYLKYSSPQRSAAAVSTSVPTFLPPDSSGPIHEVEEDLAGRDSAALAKSAPLECPVQIVEPSSVGSVGEDGARIRSVSSGSDMAPYNQMNAAPPDMPGGATTFFSNWLRFPMFYTNKDVDVEELIDLGRLRERGELLESSSAETSGVEMKDRNGAEEEEEAQEGLPRLHVGMASRVNSEKHLLPSPAAAGYDGAVLRISAFNFGDDDEDDGSGGLGGADRTDGEDSGEHSEALYF